MSDAKSDSIERSRSRAPGIVLLAIFALSLFGWFYAWPLVELIFREWATDPRAGDAAIGIFLVGSTMLGISLVLLVPSIFLSSVAKRLPLALRIAASLPAAAGFLTAIALLYRALGD